MEQHRKRTGHEKSHYKGIFVQRDEDEKGVEAFPLIAIKVEYEEHKEIQNMKNTEQRPQPGSSLVERNSEAEKDDEACSDCGKIFKSLKSIEHHRKRNHSEKPFCCEICSKVFKWKCDLEAHNDAHKRRELSVQTFYCNICSEAFKLNADLKQHKKMHYSKHIIICPDCGVKLVKSSLKSHWNTKHSGLKQFTCNICGKTSDRKDTIRIHMLTHDPQTKQSHLCSLCGKAYRSLHLRIRHERSHDSLNYLKHPCSYCGKMFSTPQVQIRHERTHTGERPFSCNECEYKAKSESNLATHKLVHTGERPLQCSRCLQRFRYHGARSKHKCKGEPDQKESGSGPS